MLVINIDPNLLRVGPFLITWHGFFTAVAVVIGVWLGIRLLGQKGIGEEEASSLAMWAVIGGVVGARLFHVVDQWELYARNPLSIFAVHEGGLAIWGVIVGGAVAAVLYARIRKVPLMRVLDAGAPPLILGMAIGRVGDIINGEHHGTPTDLPFSVSYVHPSTLGEPGVPVHLAVGYELLWDLLIFGFIMWLRTRTQRDGAIFWSMVALYSFGRFFINFFRVDSIFALGMTQAQFVALLAGAVAIWVLVFLAGREARPHGTQARAGADIRRRGEGVARRRGDSASAAALQPRVPASDKPPTPNP